MSDYQTPRKEDEAEKSLDEEDDLNDRENLSKIIFERMKKIRVGVLT